MRLELWLWGRLQLSVFLGVALPILVWCLVAMWLRTFTAGFRPGGRKPDAWVASGEVGGPQHGFACCCPWPGGPGRGQRSAVGEAAAVC